MASNKRDEARLKMLEYTFKGFACVQTLLEQYFLDLSATKIAALFEEQIK